MPGFRNLAVFYLPFHLGLQFLTLCSICNCSSREQEQKRRTDEREIENDVDISVPLLFKWCYQENGTIYSSEIEQERVTGMIDTVALLIMPYFVTL